MQEMLLYNIAISAYETIVRVCSPFHEKAGLWTRGRKDIFRRMKEAIPVNERIVWVHAASLGEFEQGRPVIEAIRNEHPEYRILLTFFSPSGYEIRKNYDKADYIFYLPSDRPSNVRKFLDIVNPEIVIFVKYEYWLNFLTELRRRNIRTFIISSIFRSNSIFFKAVGGAWRNILGCFETIFVQDDNSRGLLSDIGYDSVVVAGDTRFDRVAQIASQARKIEQIEQFRQGCRIMVAGSTWGPDEDILIPLINAHPDIRFIIAPHEMNEERISRIEREVGGGAVRYTRFDAGKASGSQVLILDTVGILSSVYGCATWSYIGGGFGVGIHNTLEAATFGLPVAFGPNYSKFKEARDLVALGAARPVGTYDELEKWFSELVCDETLLASTSAKSREYTRSHQGATQTIMRTIFG